MKTKNVNTGRVGFSVTPEKYQPVRKAILSALPRGAAGLTFNELVAFVGQNVPRELFPRPGSLSWYTKVVQLDLEAKGLIERIAGEKPQRMRRRK
jgi:hypothetical protein